MHPAVQVTMRNDQKDMNGGRTFAANSFLCNLDTFILFKSIQTNYNHRFNYVFFYYGKYYRSE